MGPRAVRLALGARCLPTVGSHSETSLPVSDMTQGIPSNCLLGPRPCTGSPLVIPDSVCPGAAVETLEDSAFEPLDRNGLGAQFLSLKGIGWGIFPSHRLTTAGAPFDAVPQGDRTVPAIAVVGCDATSADGTLFVCARLIRKRWTRGRFGRIRINYARSKGNFPGFVSCLFCPLSSLINM